MHSRIVVQKLLNLSMISGGPVKPRKLPRNVSAERRGGKVYLYFRLGKGSRIRLPGDPNSQAFREAYVAALAGQTSPSPLAVTVDPAFSLGALIASYKRSAGYFALRETSKAGYNNRLEALRIEHGGRAVAGLTRQRIITTILQPFADRPGAALDTLKKLRILIRHAIDIGWLRHDPSIGIKRPKIARIRSWTESEIDTFRKHWAIGSKQRLAFELFLNTGQRRSDVVRMSWSHLAGQKILVVQQKTGRRLVIPLHGDLAKILGNTTRTHVAMITTAYGQPFTVDGFSQWMRDAIRAAGLPLQCQPHGLRKATGRRLAESGATAKEIMSILGHTTLAEAERYTEEADQIGLAEGAVIKLEARSTNTTTQTAIAHLGKVEKNRRKSK